MHRGQRASSGNQTDHANKAGYKGAADFFAALRNFFLLPGRHPYKPAMSLGTILLIVLILMLVGVLPSWPHSKSWGYGPSGGLGLIVVILIVLVLMGRL